MRTIGNRFIVKAGQTHEKADGDIVLLEKFDNASKTKPISEIVSFPAKYHDTIKEGDKLLYHFNILTFTLKDGKKIDSEFKIKDNYYYVPENMIHALFRKDGSVELLGNWNIVEPIKKGEEVTASGIVVALNNDEVKISHGMLEGYIQHVNKEFDGELKSGDKILMSKHSDYSFKMPDGSVRWLVENRQILCKCEE